MSNVALQSRSDNSNGFIDKLARRYNPVQHIFENAGYAVGIFGRTNQHSIGLAKLRTERVDGGWRTIAVAFGAEVRQVIQTVVEGECYIGRDQLSGCPE